MVSSLSLVPAVAASVMYYCLSSTLMGGPGIILPSASAAYADGEEEEKCGLWLGPSSIKEREDHGWGHSIYTGKLIREGQTVLSAGILDEQHATTKEEKIRGDLMIPVFDWEGLDMGEVEDDDAISKRHVKRVKEDHRASEKGGEYDTVHTPAEKYSPLFQELWSGDRFSANALESHESLRIFIPGLASVAPCTWDEDTINLKQKQNVTYRDWRDATEGSKHDDTPPKHDAGSFTYLSTKMWVATRDILPGEELVVECAENAEDFDFKENHSRTRFKPKEAGGYSICLDDTLEERIADHTPNVAGKTGGQRGLFAKRNAKKGEILTSTPAIPLHKEELTMDRLKDDPKDEKFGLINSHYTGVEGEDGKKNDEPTRTQLLMNYCYGHPESSLLWLPTTPLLHAVNHASASDNKNNKKLQPNARVQWHHDKYDDAIKNNEKKSLTKRQRFHHLELLEKPASQITKFHGMGLMMDLVALRSIEEGEEIVIDYGDAWNDAWKKHESEWKTELDAIQLDHKHNLEKRKLDRKNDHEEQKRLTQSRKQQAKTAGKRVPAFHHHHHHAVVENAMTAIPLGSYVAAADYNDKHDTDQIRTAVEQHRYPYPSNLQTACWFEHDWIDDAGDEDDLTDKVSYYSWHKQEHQIGKCLLPCEIIERRKYKPGEERELGYYDELTDKEKADLRQMGPHGGSKYDDRYAAKLLDTHEDNTSIHLDCHLYQRFEYVYTDMPREGIVFVDKPHSTDVWLKKAFRQPIALPDDMVPPVWRDLSTNPNTNKGKRLGAANSNNKKKGEKPVVTHGDISDMVEYEHSVKRWTDSEGRRERLEDLEDKRRLDPTIDLEF